ncbi:hypothetical protein N7474_003308 [Penicillium riverlandense]|uniref:uncharacterized protein n=1 Tax=Penicillium riverlandense TaxID=1903569 RepID=UPI0025478245|nr:uncharacterized protein N7474_003308 [Penicillium riverlandense]KAJ5826170.1 hypothetical protein N7474_003308 [Penicillium riverlandense]
MHFVFLGTALSLLCVLGQAAPPSPSVVHTTTANSAGHTTTAKSPRPSKPAPSSIHPNGTSISWKNVKCTSQITDATLDPTARWDAADADDALKAALAAWSASGSSSGLKFPEFISNYFSGPDNWNCGDIGNTPCSTVLTCNQVKYPAGYLIMNSFSSIHQLHQQTYNALGDALNAMQNDIGTFSSTFSPQKPDDSEIIKIILDALTMGASIASSYAWNIVGVQALKQIATLATSKYFSMGKDVTNAALISFSTATSKDSLSSSRLTKKNSASNALGTENSISDALGTYFSTWTGMEGGYMTSLFSGASDDSSIGGLQELVANGSMLLLSDQVELTGMTAEAEKILYGQLIPAAWAVAPTKPYPRILRNAGGCSTSVNQDLLKWISESTMVGSYVCYNNDAYYVVSINSESGLPFQTLPGGTHSTLDGTAYGGVTLEDIVQSSYQAYQLNNNANGYKMPDLSKAIDGQGTEGDVIFQNGIRTPGFFNLPICDNITAAAENWIQGFYSDEYWPCDAPAGYNSRGTNLVFMIDLTGNPFQTDIADQNTGNSTATIYAKFNGDDKTDYKVVPGCKLDAVWPRNYGDIYFGNDNCLYDSTGAKIFDQCCDESTTDSVSNPYYGN